MIKNNGKRAIALISLVLVILVLLMITGLITYVSVDMIAEAKKVAFSKDMTTIYDSVQEYYAVNGDIPVLEGGYELSADAYRNSITEASHKTALNTEIINNGDEAATFYEIDMSKLGIEEMSYGVKKTATDVFLVSNVSQNIYYYQGREFNNNIHFSNSYILEK